ncbi:sulfatase [Tamlana sp. 2201CG12-4]|uniref:sulfatase n=1 Tax=Tamlana sp. 2201CG12-4 TaxID=3112582 RepID=UPI002DBB0966|nr:sulfatase [Tamlana sp. 2201CG12-4]MEC3908651.1 sulfatase [Tamlana sp. 2201CG12-4]
MKQFQSLLVLVIIAINCNVFAQNNKPNVLMFVVDDFNDRIAHFGDDQAITPNIDKLAELGVSFTNAQTSATYCTPSRVALMTGVAPWNSGCYAGQTHHTALPNKKTIGMLFKENNYQVYGGGKVYHHMPGFVDLRGYDEYFHWNPAQKKKGWGLFAWRDNKAAPKEFPKPHSDIAKAAYAGFDLTTIDNELEGEMADTKLVDWTVEALKGKGKMDTKKPFFLSVGLYAPHKPNFVPQKYYDLYPLDKIKLPELREDDFDDLPKNVQEIIKRRINHTHKGVVSVKDGWKRAIQGYYAALSYADAQFGRVLKALKENKLDRNTIIVFWSDNGYHLGEKKMWAKHTLWERTTNVPVFFAGPGIAENKDYRGVISLLDIYPTLVEVCGLKGATPLDGVSIVNQLKKPKKIIDRAVITAQKDGKSFSVFTNEYHYMSHQNGAGEELYSISDIHEFDNLAMDSKYGDIKQSLKAALPKSPAKMALDIKAYRLKFEGENFKWVKKTTDMKSKKGKKGNKKKK